MTQPTLSRWIRVGGQAVPIGRAPVPSAGLLHRGRASSLALADGAPVASWPLDVGGLTLAQGTATNRPTYRSAGIGGQPVVRFDGVDDALSSTAAMTGRAQPATVAVVYRPVDVATQRQILHLGGIELLQDASERPQLSGGAVLATNRAASSVIGALVIAAVNGVTSTVHVDGALAASGNAGSDGLSSNLALGYHPTTSGRNFSGDVAEFWIYDHVLSDLERIALGRYVQAVYRVPVVATATYPAAYPAAY